MFLCLCLFVYIYIYIYLSLCEYGCYYIFSVCVQVVSIKDVYTPWPVDSGMMGVNRHVYVKMT